MYVNHLCGNGWWWKKRNEKKNRARKYFVRVQTKRNFYLYRLIFFSLLFFSSIQFLVIIFFWGNFSCLFYNIFIIFALKNYIHSSGILIYFEKWLWAKHINVASYQAFEKQKKKHIEISRENEIEILCHFYLIDWWLKSKVKFQI